MLNALISGRTNPSETAIRTSFSARAIENLVAKIFVHIESANTARRRTILCFSMLRLSVSMQDLTHHCLPIRNYALQQLRSKLDS